MIKHIIVIYLAALTSVFSAEAPFHKGVNLTGWFQTSGPKQIQFTKFTRDDFMQIKSLGCDVIRLPINLHHMTSGAPDYVPDPLFVHFLDQVVDWAEELEMHLIFDNHTFSPSVDTEADVEDVLVPVWTHMAGHYKDRSNYLYYEVLNEPHGIEDEIWNRIQKRVIDAIRTVDQKHTIVIGPAGWNSYNNLDKMPGYEDDNLIFTFHFYDPFLFTHQGASWTNPSMASLSGVPFPYDASRMPECPEDLKGSWVEGNLNTSYRTDGTEAKVKQLIDKAVKFGNERNVPLFCGEMGVYIPNSDPVERANWYRIVRSYLEEKGISWTLWDYTGGFGLFEEGGNDLFDYDLNIPLVEACGFNVPEQKEFEMKPDETGFDIYTDFIGPGVFEAGSAGDGLIDYYCDNDAVAGQYCILFTEVNQYSQIGFNFRPNKNLMTLLLEGYAIDFWVKGDTPETSFDIRFIDTKTDETEDRPWRMRVTIDEQFGVWDGTWNHLQILLSDFSEHGSWDDGWFNPQGEYDWGAVDVFQIVSEQHAMKGIKFWFDQIRIVDPAKVAVGDTHIVMPETAELVQNYPNPFNPETVIRYNLRESGFVQVDVLNTKGQIIHTLVEERQSAGSHRVIWNGKNRQGELVSSGVYLYKLRTERVVQIKRMLLLR